MTDVNKNRRLKPRRRASPGAGLRSGITRRWARGSLLVIVLLLAVIEGMFLYSTIQGYYDGVQQSMYRRFSSINGQLKVYSSGTVQRTAASRSFALRRMVEQFSDKDKYEFMLLDGSGNVIASTSGTNAGGIIVPDDFEQAQTAADGYGTAVYTTSTGEPVMSVCCLVPYAAEEIVAMRLVTSLALIRQQIRSAVLLGLVAGAVALGIAAASGLYFVRSSWDTEEMNSFFIFSVSARPWAIRLMLPRSRSSSSRGGSASGRRMSRSPRAMSAAARSTWPRGTTMLRTPLTSIRGWVETLEALDDPEDLNYRKGLEIIHSETGRLYSMVEELLDFSRLQNGGIHMECRPLDLVAELTDALLFCEPRMLQEGLVLHYAEPEEMIPVYADPGRLRQVFINVLDNAIKYSAPGGRITVKLWAGEYKAFVEIIDQGRGIPPEDLGSVKGKFFKGSNAVRGSGIGLALVDSIMTALDGTLDLRSTLGKGTVVTLGLPLYKKL